MKRIRLFATLLALAALVALGACKKEEPVQAPLSAPGQTSTHAGQMPPHGMEAAPSSGDPTAVGITYDLPSGWNRVAPGSSMRIDQATIPGPAGSADMVLFFFGAGSGGGVQANLDRWAQQVESKEPPKQESFDSNGLKVTWLDTSGVLKPSSMRMGPATDQPKSRMFAAVIEGEGG
ncbi:MAG TPA: hypothetical protein VFV54_05720, partial [Thermoanaerobaculia bacterium]|nr:hypothetical protein [Thermoanaerobaculia bacterium]